MKPDLEADPVFDDDNHTNGDDLLGEEPEKEKEIGDDDDVEMRDDPDEEEEFDYRDMFIAYGADSLIERSDYTAFVKRAEYQDMLNMAGPDPIETRAYPNEDDEDGDDSDCFEMDLRKAQIALAKLSCSEGIAIGTSEAFKDFMNVCNPNFHITPEVLREDILAIYEEEKLMAKHALAIFDGQICLSVDTSWYAGIKFVCLTAHFIDCKWELKKWVLKFSRTWDVDSELVVAVVKSLKDWEIEGKVFSLTKMDADLDSTKVGIVKKCVQEKKNLQLEGKLFEVECCARVFNLMAEDAYKEISDIITKVEKLISWNFPPVWYLPAFKLKEAFDLQSTGELSDVSDEPSVDEWEKVKCVSNLVTSVYNVVKTLFETKNPTAYIFLQKFQELREMLVQESTEADNFTSTMATKMLERLDKYWSKTEFTLAIASVMDPRCKMTYFDYLSSKGEMNGNKLPTCDILDAIRGLFGDYVSREEERERSVSGSTSSDSDDDLPRNVVGDRPCDTVHVQGYNQFINSVSPPPAKSDLDRYLEEPVVSWSQDFNVLKWWKAESPKYPILSKMARDILAIPMSVATSYAAYCKDRQVDRKLINSGPEKIRNALMCTRSWAKKH